MITDRMFLLVKPTHECNLKCEYCYDAPEKNAVNNKIISDETIEKISKLTFNTYNKIQWIWHGGEPLMIDMKKYEDWHKIINSSNKRNANIEFGMQSNGYLYNKEKEEILKNLKINYTISYDMINNNEKRTNSKQISKVDPFGKLHGINVIDFDSSFKLIEAYEKLKIAKRKIMFNKIFLDKKTNENMEEYTDNWIKYFNHYIFDKEAVKDDNLFHSIFNKIFGIDKNISFCADNYCINKFMCVNPDGDIFPCDRFGNVNATKYKYGNVNDYNFSMNEYKFSEGYKNYEKDLLIAKKKCSNCDISMWCSGGCKANRVNDDGKIDVSILNEYDCIFYKKIYNFIFETIYNLSIDQLLDINPKIYEAIFEEKILLKFMIEKIQEAEINDKFIVS